MKVICGDRDAQPILYNGSDSELSLHKQRFYSGIRDKEVLDLGCGTGGAARYLRQFGNRVAGINASEAEAVIARAVMTEVLVADLDNLLELPFAAGRFDVVLLGDILEHLKYPFTLLKCLRSVLKHDGCIYVSLPNVGNIAIRLKLLFGKFEYEHAGIMDMTHLRFFTLATAREMVEAAGYAIQRETFSNWSWSLLPMRWLAAIRMRRIEQMVRNLLTRLWPGLCATQVMLVATRKN